MWTASTRSRPTPTTPGCGAAPGHHLCVRGDPRRRGPGARDLPHRARRGAHRVPLHQLRRPGHRRHRLLQVLDQRPDRGPADRAVRPGVPPADGDLAYANANTAEQPQCWDAFMNNMQVSAANRAWMPAPGNHEVEAGGGTLGYNSYHTRFQLPGNGSRDYSGNWYSFQVGSVLFVSLDGNDIAVEDDAKPGPGDRPSNLHPRLQPGRAGGLAGADAGPGQGRALGGLDRGVDAPVRDVLLGHQPRRRHGHPGDAAAAVRPLLGGPGAGRPRPRLRADPPVRGTDPGTLLRPTVVGRRPDRDRQLQGHRPYDPRRRWHLLAGRRLPAGRQRRSADRVRTHPAADLQGQPGRDRGRHLVGGARPGHRLPVRRGGVRRGPGRAAGRADHDQGELLPHAYGDGGGAVPGAGAVRQLHPAPAAQRRLGRSPRQPRGSGSWRGCQVLSLPSAVCRLRSAPSAGPAPLVRTSGCAGRGRSPLTEAGEAANFG
ncbi:hypothetical protein GXW82_31575 [Streptacidiphilus sp. 4-A2]|nr:hypothetical protein [Streptacidiphilus sp. 4-A2]